MALREEPVTLTNLCMIEKDGKILVQNREYGKWKGWAFPGGHVEPGESLVDSVKREVLEETGLQLDQVELRGIKQFFRKENGHRYIVFLYYSDRFSGTAKSSEEGQVFWKTREEILNGPHAYALEETMEVYDNPDLSESFMPLLPDGTYVVTNK